MNKKIEALPNRARILYPIGPSQEEVGEIPPTSMARYSILVGLRKGGKMKRQSTTFHYLLLTAFIRPCQARAD